MSETPCEYCDDGDGACVFPYYGTAPHVHHVHTAISPDGNPSWIGSTRLLPRDQWGDNFREDPDCPGLGTYLRCEHCGCGEAVGQSQESGK